MEKNYDSLIFRLDSVSAALVREVVYSIPEKFILDSETKFFDPAMGGGQFLRGILDRAVELGVSRESILPRLYGIERSLPYVNHAKWKLGLEGANLAVSRQYDVELFNVRFDVVVGNPPYQETENGKRKDQASNLWSKFWVKCLEVSSEGGFVSLITPTSWLSPSADLRGEFKVNGKTRLWDVFDSYSTVAQVTDVGQFFKGVGSSFGIVRVDKSGNQGLSFSEGYGTELGFLPKSNFEEVSRLVGGALTLGDCYKIDQNVSSGWRVSVPLTRKVTDDSIEILQGNEVPTSGTNKVGLYLYTHVSSEEEAVAVRETVKECKDVLNDYCRWTGFMNIQIFRKIKFKRVR